MARGFFRRRKEAHSVEAANDWPRLPGAPPPPQDEPALSPPAVAYLASGASDAAASRMPEAELLESIAAFRGSVADALFESSRDYQVLCNLVHENLPACEQAIETLRRRLAGNVHYAVLAKLDEAHALVEARVAGQERQ
jgi:hypothetical protein